MNGSTGSVDADGVRLLYSREGTGAPLFVIGSSVYYPRAFSARLRQHFDLVFADSRHFVGSYEPTAQELDRLTLDSFADDVEIVRRQLGIERMALLGHSVHAQIAIAYARKYPARTSHLVLVGGVPCARDDFAADAERLWNEEASTERKSRLATGVERLDERLAAAGPRRSFAVMYQARGPLYWADPAYDATWLLDGLENNAALNRLMAVLPSQSEVGRTLQEIKAPILVVLGRLDFAVPCTVWQRLALGLDHVTLAMLEHDGHNPQTEAPERFDATLLDWLGARGVDGAPTRPRHRDDTEDTMHEGAPDLVEEAANLMQVSREWARATAGRNLEEIVSYWADDAIVLPPDQPAVAGKTAIREFVRASQAIPGFSVSWEPQQAGLSREADVGYLIERNRFTFADTGGNTVTHDGKAVTIWRKDAAGAWKCVIDVWNNTAEEPERRAVADDPVERAKAVVRAHEAAVRAGDLDAILSNAAEDAVLVAPNTPMTVGKFAIRGLYEHLLQMGAWEFLHEYAGAEVAGDLVVLHGVARGTLTPSGGSSAPFANNFILTFKRQADGQYRFWRVAFAPAVK